MHFGNQNILYLLFGLPLVALFFLWVFRRKAMILKLLGSWDLVKRLIRTTSSTRQVIKAALLTFCVGLLIFSLSRPQYGSIERPIARKGVDIFIAIDTSLSMMASDIKPNRLARAKEQLKGLIHRLKGDRVGIITFAGTAFVQCPLTMDYGLSQNILDTIDHSSVPVQGTAIGTAIRVATRSFEKSARGERVLVLLTDGEDHETDPLEAAKEAANAGVRIYSIGIGSEKGEPIRLPDGSFKKDTEGHTVNSRLDLVLLQKIAQYTDGKTIKANPKGGLELDVLYADIGLIQKKTLRSRTYTIYEERFQYFLLPAILLLILEMLLGDRRRTATRLTTLVLVLPLLFGFTLKDDLANLNNKGNSAFQEGQFDQALEFYKNAQVESPEQPELHFNIGNVLLQKKKYEDAIKEYEQAASLFKDPEKTSRAHYNIGVARYRTAEQLATMENFQEAIKKLKEAMSSNQLAMKRNPGDPDPKYNYQQSKRLLKQLLDKLKQQEKQKQENQKQEEEKQQQEQKGQNQKQEDQKQEQKEKQGQNEKEKSGDSEKKDEQKKEGEKKEEKTTAQKQEKKEKQEGDKEEENKETQSARGEMEKTPEGEMSRQDALRLLNTLPEENKEALKRALQRQYGNLPGTDKDW